MNKTCKSAGLLALSMLFIPKLAFGCTPIMVSMFYLGPTFFGSFALSSAAGLLLAVVIKIVVFLFTSDYKSINVVWMMLLANIVSTVLGIGIALGPASPVMLVGTLPIAFVCFLMAANNFHRHNLLMKSTPSAIAIMLTALMFIDVVFYACAQNMIDVSGGNVIIYWIVKILASTMAIAITLLFSVILEEAIIARCYKAIKKEDKNFLRPVLWANIIAFLVVFGIAAAKSLPTRLKNPGFLNPQW